MPKSADRIKPSQMPERERKRVRVQMDRDLEAANAKEPKKQYRSFEEYESQSPVRAVSRRIADFEADQPYQYKKGGSIKSTASRRGDGIAQRGKTKGRLL